MRILVTGGAGFIGSHVSHALIEAGHDVVILDDLSSGNRDNLHPEATFVEGDLRSDATLDELFERFRFDAISHQAAQTSVSVSTREPVRDGDINLLGGLRLLVRAAKAQVPRFVFASTGGAIYGEVPSGQRAQVGWPTLPLSPYACSKLSFETYLQAWRRELGFDSTVLRYANVYGPRQDPHGEAGVVAIFCQRLWDGQGLRVNAMHEPGDRGCIRDYVYVGDVMRANLAALNGDMDDPIVNVGTGLETTTQDLADTLIQISGRQVEVSYGPRRAGDIQRSVLEPDATLGTPVPLREGLEQTWAWYASDR